MKESSFKIAKQIGNKGYYAKIKVQIFLKSSNESLLVEFDTNKINGWQTAALFGIEYAFEHMLAHYNPKNYRVFVKEISSNVIDTSNIIVAYVSCMAVWQAFKFTPAEPIYFDEQSGFFTFPT